MNHFTKYIFFGIILIVFNNNIALSKDYLKECYHKQVEPLTNKYLELNYTETSGNFGHDFTPWKLSLQNKAGTAIFRNNNYYKFDTLKAKRNYYYSKTQLTETELLYIGYGDTSLYTVTNDMFFDEIYESARYSPSFLLNHFYKNNPKMESKSNEQFAIFELKINKSIVRINIDKETSLINKTSILNYDDFYGDVAMDYNYQNYKNINNIYYPSSVIINKINGKIQDSLKINSVKLLDKYPPLLQKPDNYKMIEKPEPETDISIEKYNKHITFIDIKQANEKVMIVEFNDFLLVAEAPLKSENGEIIIREAKKIAPGKPIKYFIFSHHHPHYIGGIRPFIHKGATILCVESNNDYVNYFANAKHTLQPDSLELEPKPVKIENIDSMKIITDGKYKMQIYFIGEKSAHTKDYLIYYFPEDKMLFQGDLVWIKEDGTKEAAGARQRGLYNSIIDFNLEPETIIQSWPLTGYGVKSTITWDEMAKSMEAY